MNVAKRMATAAAFYTSIEPTMKNLFSRWLDESKFEDIKEYSNVIEPLVKEIGGEFIKMTKRPFGFHYSLAGVTYVIKISKTNYEYSRK